MSGREELQAEWAWKSRHARGELTSVNPVDGTATVRVAGMHLEPENVPLPLSVTVKGARSAWQRFMPSAGDHVEVAWDAKGEPRIASLGSVSYAQAAALGSLPVGDGERLIGWRHLAEGEFDARSAGGAGHVGTREGRYTAFAGGVLLSLDKAQQDLRAAGATTIVLGGDGTEIRWGEVRRKPPPGPVAGPLGGLIEKSLFFPPIPPALAVPNLALFPLMATPVPSPNLVGKEWHVRVSKQLALGSLDAYEEWAGDCRSDLGAPVLGPFAPALLRYRKVVFDDTGLLPLVKVETDQLGSTKVTFAATAAEVPVVGGGLVLEGLGAAPGASSAVPLKATFGAVTIIATGPALLPTSGITIQSLLAPVNISSALPTLSGGGVNLGSGPFFEPAVRGDTLYDILTMIATQVGLIVGQVGGATQGTAIQTALEAAKPRLLSLQVAIGNVV